MSTPGILRMAAASLAGCLALSVLPQPAMAQASLPALEADAAQCTSAVLGAPIDPAQVGEPVGGVVIDRVTWHAAGDAPAVCVVEGRILPVDRADTARPIQFAAGLPGQWNRRSIHQGGSGLNGIVPRYAPAAPRAGGPVPPPGEVARGFAAYGSDSGHGLSEMQWALNDEAVRNFGYAQIKKTHDVAQLLITRFYGEAPRYRYFVGTSQGGREALTAAQRYPTDYHGIAADVPVVGLNSLMQAQSLIRQREIPLQNWVPPTKGRAIAAEFMRQCDGLDGLQDGVINHYQACRERFDVNDRKGPRDPWKARRCPGGRDPDPQDDSEAACLTDAQVGTLEFIFSRQSFPSPRAHGARAFGMWMPSTEVVVGGLPPATGNSLLTDIRYRGQEGAPDDARVFSALGSIGVTGFLLKDLDANPLSPWPAGIEPRQRLLSDWFDSTNPDLSAFAAAGGRLLVAIGTNDTLASTGAQLDYYEALHRKMGRRRLDSFARLYVLPQRGHGLQGNSYSYRGDGRSISAAPLPSGWDRLTLLQRWVEQGVAPGRTELLTGADGSSGLMCSYPEHPHYLKGDPAQARSWNCR